MNTARAPPWSNGGARAVSIYQHSPYPWDSRALLASLSIQGQLERIGDDMIESHHDRLEGDVNLFVVLSFLLLWNVIGKAITNG